MTLLEVRGLGVALEHSGRPLVQGVSFDLSEHECLGVVGESGSGKSLASLALLGLLPAGLRASGRARFEGREILEAPAAARAALRGKVFGYIPQQASGAFDPLTRVGPQLLEAARFAFPDKTEAELREEAEALLSRLKFRRPRETLAHYPFELSGGMAQRALIAAALLLHPRVLVADEPTSALDAVSQKSVIDILGRIRGETGCALVFISHDLAAVQALAGRVIVMEEGRVVESGGVELFHHPSHPYTRRLVETRQALSRHFLEALR